MGRVVARVPGRLAVAGGIAAVLAAGVLIVGIGGLVFDVVALRPWLAVLFGINAGVVGVSMGSLGVVTVIDIVLLLLAGVCFAGFWPGPGKAHQVLMGLAAGLPFAGIAVLIATRLWGRSGLMGGGLVLSILLIGSTRYRKLGITGVAVNALLLVGDFGTSGALSRPITLVVGAGYLLLIVWFLWIALVQLASLRPGRA